MNYNIAVCITTFLRDNLLYKTLQNIVDNYPENSIILIADQGYTDSEKDITIDYFKSKIPLEYYKIPFDSGLSYARNYLVRIVNKKKIPYVLISADSIQFTQTYNFQPIMNFLEQDDKRGLVGFELLGSKCPWEYLMEVTSGGIKLSCSDKEIDYDNLKFKKVDICRNIFLAKTKTLLNLWDEDLKLGEHELAFLEYRKRGYEVYWTDSYVFKHISGHISEEYQSYRKRLQDYLKITKQKLGINGWIIYSSEVMKEIKEYKGKNKL